jgi:ABC-2 type transport system permease protein
VLRTDVAFEETAAEASTRQARRLDAFREQRHATATKVTHPARSLPLAASGKPSVALVWKNAMWIVRTGQLRGLLAPPAIGRLLVGMFGTRSEGAAMVLGGALLTLAATMLLIGPLSMRNDLRGELQHLSLVKTLPLLGRDIVLAEVASGALPLAAMQLMLGIVALLSFSLSGSVVFPPGTRLAALVTAPVLLLALNGAAFVVHNGIVLLFPGWSRLGTGGGGGIETMGLGMITLTLAVVMLLALAVVPALAFAIVLGVLRDRLAVGLVFGGWLAGLLLLAEIMLVARLLGGMLERLEPMAMEG